MNTKECRQMIYEVLDDTLEGLYYRLTMETDLSTEEIKDLIDEVISEMGHGQG